MTSRTGNKGFTLIEVMAAAAMLSLAVVLIYESFFISLDSFNYYAHYLGVVSWVDEKVWEAQDELRRAGPNAKIQAGTDFTRGNKRYDWDLSYNLVNDAAKLYRIDCVLSWREGKVRAFIRRSAYAVYEERSG